MESAPRDEIISQLPGEAIYAYWDILKPVVDSIEFWLAKLKADDIWVPADIEAIAQEWCVAAKGKAYFLASLYVDSTYSGLNQCINRLINDGSDEYQNPHGIQFLDTYFNSTENRPQLRDKLIHLRLTFRQIHVSWVISRKRLCKYNTIKSILPEYTRPALVHYESAPQLLTIGGLEQLKADDILLELKESLREGDILRTPKENYYITSRNGKLELIPFGKYIPPEIFDYLRRNKITSYASFKAVYLIDFVSTYLFFNFVPITMINDGKENILFEELNLDA